jgi:hypothetical protein
MHRRWFIGLTTLLAAVLLLSAMPARAAGSPPGDDGVVIWNEDYTLGEGEQLDGDLIVFSGDATLETGSRVTGSVIIWNGSAEVAGTIEGDLVVSGGDIHLDDSAQVEGDVVCSWNCDLEQEEGSRVDGGVIEGIPLRGLHFERLRDAPVRIPSLRSVWTSSTGQVLDWTLRAMRRVITVLVVAAVGGLVALIWPHQTTQIGRTVIEAPWPSFGIGLLTVVAATALIIALALTICLSPAAALVALALGAAGLFGWIGVGAQVGERLLKALNVHEIAPLWAAGLGTLLITLVGVGLSVAFCLALLGWLVILVLGCLGLGAVVLTRFGTMAYVPSTGEEPGPSRPTLSPSAPTSTAAPEPPESPAESPEGEAAGDETSST